MAVIDQLDVPAAEILVEEVVAKNLSGQQLATLATQVQAKCLAVSGDTGKGEAARPGTLRGEVIPSPDGGSVLVVAPRDSVPGWKDLLDRLDKREPVETVTYSPRSFPAKDVAKLLEQAVREGGGAQSGDQWSGRRGAARSVGVGVTTAGGWSSTSSRAPSS